MFIAILSVLISNNQPELLPTLKIRKKLQPNDCFEYL
jgi:hypothetical protein